MRAELTGRALLVGCAIGTVLAAANVYTGLKLSMIDGGSITAALLGFMLFASFGRLGRRPYSALENNITQTTAASAAIMGYAAGLGGPVPAMALMGQRFPAWAITVWGGGLAIIGIVAAVFLRRKLIVEDALPFPTGTATGDLIETMFAARASALRRARLLVGGAVAAAAITWLRDGHPRLLPDQTLFGLTLGAVSLNALSVGISWSPLLLSTGVMMGLRAATSMALGSVIAWVGIAPWLVRQHIVAGAGFSACMAWMVWPGLGLLLAGSFLPLVLDWRSIARGLRDIGQSVRDRGAGGAGPAGGSGAALLLVAGMGGIVVVARAVFGLAPLVTLLALIAALILVVVSSRAAGETDLAPVGPMGTLTQLVFSGYGTIASMLAGSTAFGASAQAAQTLWAFKAGQRLQADPRAQLMAQLTGALLGAIVVAPVYLVIVKTYGIGNESLPAPAAMSWKATAEAIRGGLSTLPAHAPLAAGLGLLAGTVLALAGRSRWAAFVPSPAALGMALLTPASLSVAILLGAVLATLARRLRPTLEQDELTSLAAGGITGESVMGVIIAFLVASGVMSTPGGP